MPEETLVQLWGLTLLLALGVAGVVWALLESIRRRAHTILTTVARLWTVGQQVANNTIQLGALEYTNRLAAEISASGRRLVQALGAAGVPSGGQP